MLSVVIVCVCASGSVSMLGVTNNPIIAGVLLLPNVVVDDAPIQSYDRPFIGLFVHVSARLRWLLLVSGGRMLSICSAVSGAMATGLTGASKCHTDSESMVSKASSSSSLSLLAPSSQPPHYTPQRIRISCRSSNSS